MKIPTVKVKTDDGHMVINESDLTDDHDLYDEKPVKDPVDIEKLAEYIIENSLEKLKVADAKKAGFDATGDEIKEAFALDK